MTAPITSENKADGKAEAKSATKSPCIMAGMCVCQGEGRLLDKFRVRFLQAMKAVFKPTTPQRQLLVDGKVVCCLRNQQAEAADGQAQPGPHEVWLHIGYMLFSPYHRPRSLPGTLGALQPAPPVSSRPSRSRMLLQTPRRS